ncbi:MAG: acetolactate decarboxylase [Deltaproteobacteria bacterium]|nr:acetolactate decarboxylase [Deltaproteobacteria bacterium]
MNPEERQGPPGGSIYFCAPVNALVEGIYEERIPFGEIKKHGDFGLGTFHDLDGEMVMLDGCIYRIASDGKVRAVEDNALTPFACVTFYRPVSHDAVKSEMSHESFMEWLQGLLPSSNLFYALRIEGEFARVRARSVPKQDNYRPLLEVAREQSVFEFSDLEGTLVGFYTPSFMSSVSVPGMHLHFLSADLRCGGHLLECIPRKARVGVQFIYRLELSLPLSLDYLTWEFDRDVRQDLDRVEK